MHHFHCFNKVKIKRPLAIFCGFFTLVLLFTVIIPFSLILPLLLLVAAAFSFFCISIKKERWYGIGIFMLASFLAFSWRFYYSTNIIMPVVQLVGKEETVFARVVDEKSGNSGDTVNTTLYIYDVQDIKIAPFTVQVQNVREVGIGSLVSCNLRFSKLPVGKMQYFSLAKGLFVNAHAQGEYTVTGVSHTLQTRLRLLQHQAGNTVFASLPSRLSSVLAALTVGDMRFLTEQTKEAYRAAGLSHILVVSGLHLSVFGGTVYAGLRFIFRKRQMAAFGGIISVVFFMFFTGMTTSVVRSGITLLLVFIAALFYRESDAYTSLAVAAFILCVHNPYTIFDLSFLLSFTATIGTLAGGKIAKDNAEKWKKKPKTPYNRVMKKVGLLFPVPVLVTIATFPVLIWGQANAPFLSIPVNILVIPLLSPLLLIGMITVLPTTVPLFGILAKAAAIVCGGILVLLEKVTNFCQEVSFSGFVLGGTFALTVVLLLYALGYYAVKTKQVASFLLSLCFVFPFIALVQYGFSNNIIRCILAGNGTQASLVVVKEKEAIVVCRSGKTLYTVKRILQQNNVKKCALLIDLRFSVQSTEYIDLLGPLQTIVPARDILSETTINPFEGALVTIKKQQKGTIVCLDFSGYKIGIVNGSMNLTSYSALDILLPGKGVVQGNFATTLIGREVPLWLPESTIPKVVGNGTEIWLRPQKSVVFKEGYDVFAEG